MPLDTRSFETSRQSAWPWRAGIVVSNPELAAEIAAALAEVRATCLFQIAASASVLEIFALIERDRPDLLFVELSATSVPAREWMAAVQGEDGRPLVAAVHVNADPVQMISALRAGATEFLSLPLSPAIFGALDRIAARLDSSRPAEAAQCLVQALQIDPGNPLGWANLASMNGQLGRHAQALDCAERALALDPHMVEAQLHRARAAQSLGKPEVVRAASEALAKLPPEKFRRMR